MLKKYNLISLIVLAFLILSFVFLVYAQSNKPVPRRGEITNPTQKHTSNIQQPAETNQRGTEQLPLIVKTINPPKTEAEADQEKRDREEKAANDRHLVWFTGALVVVAIFQLGAFILQAVYLYKGFKATTIAADAAKKSADALSAIERAYLFVKITMENPDAEGIAGTIDDESQYNPDNVKIIVTNHGKTPALLTGISYTIKVISDSEIDNYISEFITNIYSDMPPGTAIIDNTIAKPPFPAGFFMDRSLWRQISMETAFLTCLGCIHYEDVFGNPHKTVFCWKYERYTGFHPDKDPKRNERT